jgi:5-methylcytosine-specific restriction endonuclease McrA
MVAMIKLGGIEQKFIDGVLHTLCACGTCGRWFVAHKGTGSREEIRYIKGHYCIGKHPTEASKEKNRQAHLGKPAWNSGKTGIYTEETLRKIRDARAKQAPRIDWHQSEEANEKNRVAHLGKVHSEESKIKVSISLKGQKRSKEQKQKLSESKKGSKNPSWLGGISRLPYTQDWTDDLRDAIRKRDGYQCQLCNAPQQRFEILLDVHHCNYDKENCDPRNLITLCKSCHIKTNKKRDIWEMYFNRNRQQRMVLVAI